MKNVAYLGPHGTHSELALRQFLSPKSATPATSLSEVFRLVANGEASAGLVPFENLVRGPISEALDLLLQYKDQICITDSYLHPVKHALGRIGAETSDVTTVFSHPQALEQCSSFLSKHLASAERCPVESTARAIQIVKEQGLDSAVVIAAEVSLKEAEFHIIEPDISNIPENKTRFVLIEPRNTVREENLKGVGSQENFVTSIVVEPGRDRQGLLFELLDIISIRYRVNLLSIHSRPDMRGGFVFHLDLEGHVLDEPVRTCLQALQDYCLRETGETADIVVFGSYPRLPFYKSPFETIAIIGGKGVMGCWFEQFLQASGVNTLCHDQNSKGSLKETVQKADVILLSIPMNTIAEVMEELKPHLRPGQLVVENCSIKNSSLPHILAAAPPEVEALGIHTMFSGNVESLRGQNIIVTKTNRSGSIARAFEDLFYKHGAIITYASSEEHDQVAAFVQSLLHLVLISLGSVMSETFRSKDELSAFSTPNLRSLLESLQRVSSQNDELLADIQLLSDKAPRVRKRFLEVFFRLCAALEHKDSDALTEEIKRVRTFLASQR